MHNLNLRNIRQTQITEHFYEITGLFKIVNVMNERLWNCTRQNESEEADNQPNAVCFPGFDSVLDGEKYYKGHY